MTGLKACTSGGTLTSPLMVNSGRDGREGKSGGERYCLDILYTYILNNKKIQVKA